MFGFASYAMKRDEAEKQANRDQRFRESAERLRAC